MKGIVLINPPSPFLLSEKTMPPLGILYVASSLKKGGVKVNFVDLAGNPEAEIPKSKLYGITATTPQFPHVLEISSRIHKGEIVIGGPHPTVDARHCLDVGFDSVIIGEGEKAIFRFIGGERGLIKEPPIKNLDEIPFPDRSLVKGYSYKINGIPATTMVTSRGCYYRRCGFCCQNWGKIRFRSAENVIEELKEIRLKYGYHGIMIYDDEFFCNRKRDFKICFMLEKLGFIWRCFSRADLIDKTVASVASTSGCREMLLGFESGSDRILENINKGCTVEQNKKAIEILNTFKIRVKSAMIIMLPGESLETLKETWAFCEEMEPFISDFDFTLCTPYPKSDIYENPTHYDFNFDKDAMYSAYKGAGNENWEPPRVWTKMLSFEEGLKYRDNFEKRFKFKWKKVSLNGEKI